MIFRNRRDPRYRFELRVSEHSAVIVQLGTPPGNPPMWLPAVWGQWRTARTTAARALKTARFLRDANPSTKRFQRKVAWIY